MLLIVVLLSAAVLLLNAFCTEAYPEYLQVVISRSADFDSRCDNFLLDAKSATHTKLSGPQRSHEVDMHFARLV